MIKNISISNKKGFSLIELCIALGIVAILTGTIVPVFIKRIQIKAGEKTAAEISVIQQAALAYFTANNAWPASLAALQNEGFLNPSWVANNPWQNPYTISSTLNSFTVSTTVPEAWTALVARDLATSSVSGTAVTSSVPSPGSVPEESLPIGAIVMWSGAIASIPSGWALCDGTNGTPDLRNRFIRGVPNSSTNPGATGGSTTHDHSGQTGIASSNSNDHGREDSAYSKPNPEHTHSISSTNHLPPYYEVAFIMKIE